MQDVTIGAEELGEISSYHMLSGDNKLKSF